MSELSKVERIDRFGHCCYCSDYLLTKRVVDGKVTDMFLPTYDQTVFLLDNGSQMQITLCKKCKSTLELNDAQVHADIMSAVFKGWELESNALVADETKPEWTKEVGEKYLKDMSELSIHCNSETLDAYKIQEKVIELRNLSVEEIIEDTITQTSDKTDVSNQA